jgi:tRNA/rRNA methyltransferase
VLYGAEPSGLKRRKRRFAHKIVTVPINPQFRSLNLAQAVILVAYEWSKGEALAMPTVGEPEEPRATHDQLEGLIGQVDQSLADAGYFFPPDRVAVTKLTMRTILTEARMVQPRGSSASRHDPHPDQPTPPRLTFLASAAKCRASQLAPHPW